MLSTGEASIGSVSAAARDVGKPLVPTDVMQPAYRPSKAALNRRAHHELSFQPLLGLLSEPNLCRVGACRSRSRLDHRAHSIGNFSGWICPPAEPASCSSCLAAQ